MRSTTFILGFHRGYLLEEIPPIPGATRGTWLLCWGESDSPVMVHKDGSEEVHAPAGGPETTVVDTYDPDAPLARWGNNHRAHAFREVTAYGVTWQVLLDDVGYPWIIQRKRPDTDRRHEKEEDQ